MKKLHTSAAAGAALLCICSSALGQEPGESGTFALGADRLFGYYSYTETVDTGFGENTRSISSFSLLGSFNGGAFVPTQTPRLSLDVFLGPGVSLGGSAIVNSISVESEDDEGGSSESDATLVMFAPRVGYAVMFNDVVGLWPRGGLTFTSISNDDSSATQSYFTAEGMLILSPAESVGLTLGPTIDVLLGQSAEVDGEDLDLADTSATLFGLQAGLLAWF